MFQDTRILTSHLTIRTIGMQMIFHFRAEVDSAHIIVEHYKDILPQYSFSDLLQSREHPLLN